LIVGTVWLVGLLFQRMVAKGVRRRGWRG